MANDLLRALAETWDRATRVRVFDSGSGQPTRKRRQGPPVLADQHETEALIQLRAALTLRPDTDDIALMRWPDLWLELHGADRTRLTTVGLIYPRWLRGETGGDLELQDPTAIVQWLTRWAPDAAATLVRRVPPKRQVLTAAALLPESDGAFSCPSGHGLMAVTPAEDPASSSRLVVTRVDEQVPGVVLWRARPARIEGRAAFLLPRCLTLRLRVPGASSGRVRPHR